MKTVATKLKWLFFALFVLLMAACTAEPSNLWLDTPGWSRGHRIGQTTALDPVLPARDGAGNLYFLLVHDESEQPSLQFLSLDNNGQSRWQVEVPLSPGVKAEEPGLFWTSQSLRAYWLQDDALFSLELSPDGQALGDPTLLSGEQTVHHFTAAQSSDDRMEVWFDIQSRTGGIYRLDRLSQPQLVSNQGMNPDAFFDQAGGLHVAWVTNQPGDTEYHFFYAYDPEGQFQPGSQAEVYGTRFALTSTFLGPHLGFDGLRAYFFWSEHVRTGLSAGTTRARYTVLPMGSDKAPQEEALYFPYDYHFNYSRTGDWQTRGELALLDDQLSSRTSNLTDFFTSPQTQNDTMILALRGRLSYLRNKESSQVGIVYFEGGRVQGYQLLSFSRTYSQLPAVWSDQNGYLNLTWHEASSDTGNSLYFASTSPGFIAAFDRLVMEDYSTLAIEIVLGMFSGLFLIFLPLIWIVAPAILLLLSSPLRRESDALWAPGVLFSLALSLGAYWWGKLAFFPWITDYVPFSAWVPFIPPSWEQPLMILVPVLITFLALGSAWAFTFRRDRRSALFFTLIYTAIDGLLTVAIYGVVFYSAV